jgi:hypothetical protein
VTQPYRESCEITWFVSGRVWDVCRG